MHLTDAKEAEDLLGRRQIPSNEARLALPPSPRLASPRPPARRDMSFFKITLHRSAIGLPRRTRAVLEALGLRKRSQTVFQRVSPDSVGMLMKVKELVRVDEVGRAQSKAEIHAERKPDPGFYVERELLQRP